MSKSKQKTKKQRAEIQAVAKARIARRKLQREGLSRSVAQAEGVLVRNPSLRLSVLEQINRRLARRL